MATTVQAERFPDLGDELLYPRMSDAKIAKLEHRGKRRSFAAGELLYDQGARDAPFFVVDEGEVQFIDRRPEGDIPIATADRRTFLGDIAVFTGEPSISACIALEP